MYLEREIGRIRERDRYLEREIGKARERQVEKV